MELTAPFQPAQTPERIGRYAGAAMPTLAASHAARHLLSIVLACEQRRADRAAEVAERRGQHVRRPRVDEQVRHHGLANSFRIRLSEPRAEAAPDHHRLDV